MRRFRSNYALPQDVAAGVVALAGAPFGVIRQGVVKLEPPVALTSLFAPTALFWPCPGW